MLDLRRHPVNLRGRHWRDALPWLFAGTLPATLVLGAGVLVLPDAAHWQDRWLAHEVKRQQVQSALAQARAEQARQSSAASHALQWQAWQGRQGWLAQLWDGLSQLPAGVHLEQLQMDDNRVQLQLSATRETAIMAVLHSLQVAGTGPWQVRQQTLMEAPARPALPAAGSGSGNAQGRWLFVLQLEVPASASLSVNSPSVKVPSVASVPDAEQGSAPAKPSPVVPATTAGRP